MHDALVEAIGIPADDLFQVLASHDGTTGMFRYDPDYLGVRPQNSADSLCSLFPQTPVARHLDYGGGNGMLANILKGRGWDSSSYDPFLERARAHESRGRFDLITAFEVFEHVPDVNALIRDLDRLRTPTGIVLFSTLLSDGERLTVEVAATDHVAIFKN